MRAVIQRVSSASVAIRGETVGRIGGGLLVLVGVEAGDTPADARWLAGRVVPMRVFPDAAGKMNRSVIDAEGGILVISQFTLFASTAGGNRPSFIQAARPEEAVPLYERFLPLAEFHRQVGALFGWVKTAPLAQGATEILIPGEPEARLEAERRAQGIPIEDQTWSQIEAAAAELGVA